MGIKVKLDSQKIEKLIEREFRKHIYKELLKHAKEITQEIKEYNIRLWMSSDTYDSLLSGKLTHELGFPKGQAQYQVDTIINELAKSIIVLPRVPRKNKSGQYIGLSIKVFKKYINKNIFSMDEAVVKIEKKADKVSGDGILQVIEVARSELPWLEWLLYKGNSYIIFNYQYVDVVSDRSRSGKGLMIKDDTSNWKVPAEYSGTKNSNWFTRTLQEEGGLVKEYSNIIKKYFND